MRSDKNDISPIQAAKNLTPQWMMRITDFDGLEIGPCAVIGHTDDGEEIAEQCEPAEASFWTVFGHLKTGGVDTIEDFNTEGEAQKFHDRLMAVYPHLGGEATKPRRQSPRKEPTP
jgi:hypothetical protein